MADDTNSSYQPSFGRRGNARPRFFAQADGESDTGSLGTLLNDVSKAVKLNTGFSGVVVSASSLAAANSNAASSSQPAAASNSIAASSEKSSSTFTVAPPARFGVGGGIGGGALPAAGLSSSCTTTTTTTSTTVASVGDNPQAVGSNRFAADPAATSASAVPLRPPVFGRRVGANFGFESATSNENALPQPAAQQLQHHQQHQHQQREQQQQQHQQSYSLPSASPPIPASTAPVSKFGFKFGGLRPPPAPAPAPVSVSAILSTPATMPDASPVRNVSLEPQQQQQHNSSSPSKVLSSSSPSNQPPSHRPFVAANVPSLLTSRASKPQSGAPPAAIDVSNRAAQLMREIGEDEDQVPAVSTSAGAGNVWRERSSRSVAGDVGPHIVGHAKVDTGLPRELASRDRARIAVIYRESERNKKAVERLRAQLQDALSSDRVAMLENAISERDRVIDTLTRDNRMLQRNALMQEKELEGKRDIENEISVRVKEKNEELRIIRERLKKFKELHGEQQKALYAQQQQQQRLQAAYDDVRRKLAAALSDPAFDADEARKQLLERDSRIASLERELRIFRHKKESDGRLKGRDQKTKEDKLQQLQAAVEEAQLQLGARGRELQAQSLRIKALEEEVHVWQQRARRPAKSNRNDAPLPSIPYASHKVSSASPSPFLTDGLGCGGAGADVLDYRSAITPPSSGSSPPAPAPVQRIVSRVKTPPPPPKVQISNQQPVSMPSKLLSVNALDTKSGSSIDDLAYASDFDDIDEGLENTNDCARVSVFQPTPPMRPPHPTSLPSVTNGLSRIVAAPAPTNASLARGRPR